MIAFKTVTPVEIAPLCVTHKLADAGYKKHGAAGELVSFQ